MKIFHTEKCKETVYVQKQDLMYLLEETNIPIPASIFTLLFTGIAIVTDENRFDFVRFDKKSDVKFFKNLDFIIDFDQYKDLTDDQLEEEIHKLEAQVHQIFETWNNMSKKEKMENVSLYDKYRNIRYIISFLHKIYAIKHGKRYMSFPQFVDIPK